MVELHTSRSYLAYMLGFKPGFPYLGVLDDKLAAPRLDAPRLKVPAGSVGIAGKQTGIYPVTSPGGWRILGRTPLRIFDPERKAPFLILPGDEVRFEAIGRRRFEQLAEREMADPVGGQPGELRSRHSRASGNPVFTRAPASPLDPRWSLPPAPTGGGGDDVAPRAQAAAGFDGGRERRRRSHLARSSRVCEEAS